MPVVILSAAALILGGVVVVAMGRGGELGRDRSERPARPDFLTWSDVANYRPPGALLGYQAAATEHALSLIARTIAERDAEIDWLRNRLAEVSAAHRADPGGSEPDYPARFPAGSDPAGNAQLPASLRSQQASIQYPGEGE